MLFLYLKQDIRLHSKTVQLPYCFMLCCITSIQRASQIPGLRQCITCRFTLVTYRLGLLHIVPFAIFTPVTAFLRLL